MGNRIDLCGAFASDIGGVMSADLHGQFLKSRSQEFGSDRCFICGMHIPEGSDQRTAEHVFPKWLLRELDLWDRTITQIDGRTLAYRRMTVACCLTCNGTDFSPIESRVKAAYRNGLEAFTRLDRRDLFLWLGKIYYGLVCRESLQPRDVSDQDGARLVPEEHLKDVAFHHFLLQAVAGVVAWAPPDPGPASFHFFECLDDEDPVRRFDYMDDLFVPMLGIRMGKIGVVCVLQDWGRSEDVQQPHLNVARGIKLHPTQFREAYGRLNYMTKASWKNKIHPIIGGKDVVTVLAGPPDDFAGTFVVEDFARVMAGVWEVPVEAIYKDGHTVSTIYDTSAGVPTAVPDQRGIFTAPYGNTGLWPAHRMDLREQGYPPTADWDRFDSGDSPDGPGAPC